MPGVAYDTGELVPVDTFHSFLSEEERSVWETIGNVPSRILRDMNKRALDFISQCGLTPQRLGVTDAVRGFSQGLTNFLKKRVSTPPSVSEAYTKSRIEKPVSPPKIYIEVHSQRSGLKILYAPAYFLVFGAGFGGPSTPVRGHLPPGLYIFGGEDGSNFRSFDNVPYDVPPPSHSKIYLSSV